MNTVMTAYLGPEGSWSHEAAERMMPASESVPCGSIREIVEGVRDGRYSYGVIPVENSVGGSVPESMDCLYEYDGVQACGEKIMRIRHSLMAKGKEEDIQRVISHRNAMAQCAESISKALPGIGTGFASSTSSAAREAFGDPSTAVVGSSRLASIYHLNIIVDDITDRNDNYTRFLLVSTQSNGPTGKDRTSICITLPRNEPASLWRALEPFASGGLNLSRIESRPDPASPGEYRFFLDIHGHSHDDGVKAALDRVKGMSSGFRLLGSYGRDDWPRGTGTGHS